MTRPISLRKLPRLRALALLLAALGASCSDDSGDASPGGGAAGASVGGSSPAGGGASGETAGAGNAGGGAAAGSGGSAAGGSAAGSSAAGTGGAAGSGEGGGSAADAGGGASSNIQRCEFEGACLEFRDHAPAPACQESNAANCASLYSGTYAEGPCPPEYELRELEETFCGPTATFTLPSDP